MVGERLDAMQLMSRRNNKAWVEYLDSIRPPVSIDSSEPFVVVVQARQGGTIRHERNYFDSTEAFCMANQSLNPQPKQRQNIVGIISGEKENFQVRLNARFFDDDRLEWLLQHAVQPVRLDFLQPVRH